MMNKVLDLSKLQSTVGIIESICNWNAARYTQEMSVPLTVALLTEEMDETVEAADTHDLVAICDGYADIFYVAIGGLWKHGLSYQTITARIDELGGKTGALPMIYESIDNYEASELPEELMLIALKAIEGLEKITKSSEAAFSIVRAVCNSNDTKVVKKTASDVKANISKGEAYVSPNKAIKSILNSLVVKPNE